MTADAHHADGASRKGYVATTVGGGTLGEALVKLWARTTSYAAARAYLGCHCTSNAVDRSRNRLCRRMDVG